MGITRIDVSSVYFMPNWALACWAKGFLARVNVSDRSVRSLYGTTLSFAFGSGSIRREVIVLSISRSVLLRFSTSTTNSVKQTPLDLTSANGRSPA
jgi:hypothetical protein